MEVTFTNYFDIACVQTSMNIFPVQFGISFNCLDIIPGHRLVRKPELQQSFCYEFLSASR